MRIGVLRETQAGERRVALTPDVTRRLMNAGHSVVVEMLAGAGAGLRDVAYEAQGATIEGRDEVLSADLITTVNAPPDEALRETTVLGLLRPLEEPWVMAAYADRGITALAFELLPRT